MENRDYIIGIDVGSSNVVMAAATRQQDGKLDILGVDIQSIGEGVKDGCVHNIFELGDAIARCKQALENELGRRIDSAYVGVSGRDVYCVQYEESVQVRDKEGCITEEDVHELEMRAERVIAGDKDKILSRHPLRYRIDGVRETDDPRGCFGRKLSAIYLMVLISRQQEDRIRRALHRAGIECSGLTINPMVLPSVLLSEAECKDGVAIVDLGSELTDIVVVRGNKIQHFASLPIGASSIDADLYEFLKIPQVDKVKKSCCSVISESVPCDTTIGVQMMGRGRARKQILQRNISEIIEERLKDIARFVLRELRSAKCITKLPYGVVLTGGSAYLADIEQLFSRELGIEVRLGQQINGISEASAERISEFAQAVVIGILHYGSTRVACKTTEQPSTHATKVEPKEQPTPEAEENDIFHQSKEEPAPKVERGVEEAEVLEEAEVENKPSEVVEVESESVDEERENPTTERENEEPTTPENREATTPDHDTKQGDGEKKDKGKDKDKDKDKDKGNGSGNSPIKRLLGSLVGAFNSALGYNEEL